MSQGKHKWKDNIAELLRALRNTFVPFFVVALLVGTVFQMTGILYRTELQSINYMFEVRPWIVWSQEGLSRLQPSLMWQHHQAHDIPRSWYSWDYTLTWLIENNHPAVNHKFVIFNHLVEDEPPIEALASNPWLKPLMQYPISRKSMSEIVDYLAGSGARLIILDNDFPQYSPDDKALAAAIHNADARKVPVLIAGSINRRSNGSALQLYAPTMPSGLLQELQKIEPGVDIERKYLGITTFVGDDDQVVRRMVTRVSDGKGAVKDSIAIKALQKLGQPAAEPLPQLMDVDFAAAPNSNLYPVRPLWYLVNPEKRASMKDPASQDVTLKDAIVILGDGVIDLHPTPGTNRDVNLMSGSELLAQAIDTMSRQQRPQRLEGWAAWQFIMVCIAASALVMTMVRLLFKGGKSLVIRAIRDGALVGGLVLMVLALSTFMFAFGHLITPVVVPLIAVVTGAIGCFVWEREQARLQSLLVQLEAARLTLQEEKLRYEMELQKQAAEASNRQMQADILRRQEFVRCINHDLKAPVTVLNWTLAMLKGEGLQSKRANERIEHLERTSDRLYDLMAQLVRNYESAGDGEGTQPRSVFDVNLVVEHCTRMSESLAEMRRSTVTGLPSQEPLTVNGIRADLERALENVIRNAILHNPPGTTVEVQAASRALGVTITVTDDGKGIPAGVLPRVFETGFSTSHGSDAHEGLGLAIVKQLVERYGGTVSIDSIEDAGTTVTISMPAVEDTKYGGMSRPAVSTSLGEHLICRKL